VRCANKKGEAVKKLAAILDTTVGYLLGEAKEEKILKDPPCSKGSTISTPFLTRTKNTSSTPLMD